MSTSKIHATARIRLFPTHQGGRRAPITAHEFSCPIFFGAQREQGYECRLFFAEAGAPLEPGGADVVVALSFLSPDLVAPFLQPGARFVLWEAKDIGEGEMIELHQ